MYTYSTGADLTSASIKGATPTFHQFIYMAITSKPNDIEYSDSCLQFKFTDIKELHHAIQEAQI